MNIREKINDSLERNGKIISDIITVCKFILILFLVSFLIKSGVDIVNELKISANNLKTAKFEACEKSEHRDAVLEKIETSNKNIEESKVQYENEQAAKIAEESAVQEQYYEYVEQPIQNPIQVPESTSADSASYGTYKITAYTWTGNPMANGEYPYVGCAASCDFPIGTVIEVVGIGTYVVKDVCPTSGIVDLYMNTYDECMNFGVQYAEVRVIQ